MLRKGSPDPSTDLRAFGAFKQESSLTKIGIDLDVLKDCLVQGTHFTKNDGSLWNIEISDTDKELFLNRKSNGSRMLSTNIFHGDESKNMQPTLGFTFILPDKQKFSIKLVQFKAREESKLRRTDTIRLELDQFG